MKVNSLDKKNISFNGFYNSKSLKKILSFAENNGALFASGVSLALSATVRPAMIMATPDINPEDKKLACTKAVSSAILDAMMTLLISLPIVKAVGLINKKPDKYLTKETINNLKEGAENLKDSKAYTMASQMFKLGIGIIIAVPKAITNLLLMPFVNNVIFERKKQEINANNNSSGDLQFKGNNKDTLSKIIAKIINKKGIQAFSKKNQNSNFPMHINTIKDILSTSVFVYGTSKTNNIKDDRKRPLMYNSVISTLLCIIGSYCTDYLTDNFTQKFTAKLKTANKNDPNLNKYINGVKIAKPILIMGAMYYAVIPVISTFVADKLNKKITVK